MLILRNKFIPFNGFRAMSFCGILFVRGNSFISEDTIRHENIHFKQQLELLFVIFFVWYFIEYIIRLFMYSFDSRKAYRSISFEREARAHQSKATYYKRRMFGFLRYI